MKYTFIKTKNKIIAFSSYGGKIVKGIAKCNPEDIFDETKGQELAAARCSAKIATKRRKNAQKMLKEADIALLKAQKRAVEMRSYLLDSTSAEADALENLDNVLKSL